MNSHTLKYHDTTINFTIQRKPKLKRSYISVSKNGIVVKVNSKIKLDHIIQMVQQKASWIIEKQELYNTRKQKLNNSLYYLGEELLVDITSDGSKKQTKVRKIGSAISIITPNKATLALDVHINKFYKQQAQLILPPLVFKWADIMNVKPNKLSFRHQKSRWGSCSSINNISLNCSLMKLNLDLIEYVIVHELSHIIHKNHSQQFWQCVEKYIPDYKLKIKQIRALEKIVL